MREFSPPKTIVLSLYLGIPGFLKLSSLFLFSLSLRLARLLALAPIHDQLVNYTANLTEERDELNANLEEAKKALQREMATRIALESKGHMPQGRKVQSTNGCGEIVPYHSCFSSQVSMRGSGPVVM